MRNIPFTKMHGAGNDFIVVDNRRGIFPSRDADWIRRICLRHDGIGAEGVLLIEPDTRTDFSMRFFNPDGGEAEMCGNGARCIARQAHKLGIAKRTMLFSSRAGDIRACVRRHSVAIQLPPPRDLRINLLLKDPALRVDFINTGVPHTAAFVKNIRTVPLAELGSAVRHHPLFSPEGTNFNAVQRLDEHMLAVRTYERGVEAETPACGTGITASALLAALRFHMNPPIAVRCAHGDILTVRFPQSPDGAFSAVELEGPAVTVFEGTLPYQRPRNPPA